MDFYGTFDRHVTKKGTVSLAWMGQAGFLLKNSTGKVLVLDVYLSDLSEKQDGNKRLMPALCRPEEIKADVVLASHHHTDHLDLVSIPAWLGNGARLYCCQESGRICREAGFAEGQIMEMKAGDRVTDAGYVVEAVFADHGDTAPEALGFLIETEGVRIYFTGDTAYQHTRMQEATERDIDILLLPINGEYGNMNERDAAMLAARTEAALTIPCHFWMFARHQGSPWDFSQAMKEMAPACPFYVMAQGEILDVKQRDSRT